MPPFTIEGTSNGRVRWTMSIDEAKELAEYLEAVDNGSRLCRASEMAFDLRQGVQLALARHPVFNQ